MFTVNIWNAVIKEKGREKDTTVEQITRSLNSFEIPIAFWRKKYYNKFKQLIIPTRRNNVWIR